MSNTTEKETKASESKATLFQRANMIANANPVLVGVGTATAVHLAAPHARSLFNRVTGKGGAREETAKAASSIFVRGARGLFG